MKKPFCLIAAVLLLVAACGNEQGRALSSILDANREFTAELESLTRTLATATNRDQVEAGRQAYLAIADRMDERSRSIMKRFPAATLDAVIKEEAYKKAVEAAGHVLGEWNAALAEAEKRLRSTLTNEAPSAP